MELTRSGVAHTVVTGAGTAAYEKYVNKMPTEDAVKLGAVMVGSQVVTQKIGGYMGMNKPGLNMILTAGLYTWASPKLVDTGYGGGEYMPRALAALGGLVTGNVVNRIGSRMAHSSNASFDHPSNGAGAMDVSTYSATLGA
jgi:hypothetical protein